MPPALFPDLPEIDGVVEQPTAGDYALAARFALERKKLPRAVEQIAAALALEPSNAEHARVLDSILAASRAPLDLVRVGEGETFYGLLAVRARVLAREERWTEALEALTEAVVFRPDAAYLAWARAWFEDDRAARRTQPEAVASLLIRLSDAARRGGASEQTAENLGAALELGALAAKHHAAHAGLAVARSRLLRAIGHADEAARVLGALGAEAGTATAWELAVERAALARDAGDADGRIAWLERAAAARADDRATYVDLGDARLETGALEGAIEAYERGLERGAGAAARAGRAYARWLLGGDAEIASLDAQGDLAVARFREDALGYDGVVLDPLDPVVGVIRGVLRRAIELPRQQRVRARVHADRPLAPSARLAFEHGLLELGRAGDLELEHESRRPPRLGGLWKQQGAQYAPLHAAPPPALLRRLQTAAAEPFSWPAFGERAVEIARSAANPGELLGAVGHPPSGLGGDPVEWIGRVQILAALAIAAHAAPWAEREPALGALVAASDDWTSIAGVLGLGFLAEREPARRAEIVERLAALIPAAHEPLPLHARAVAIAGFRLVGHGRDGAFLRLRARSLLRTEL